MSNVYFELTRAFNARGLVAVLGSGQAVVYHRLAIMSKDGDWILRETPAACERVLDVLGSRGAHYRAAPPLDIRWLRGGWSSHFEHRDAEGHRIRCDFFTRPPRLGASDLHLLFDRAPGDGLAVVDIEPLVRMKQTQRAKDYAVISALAERLPPDREMALTWDPDRVLALVARGVRARRPAAEAAARGGDREAVAVALAREANALQIRDAARVRAYAHAMQPYLRAFQDGRVSAMPLPEAHAAAVALAERLLPERPDTLAP
jgi:hypothetical protein